jgi:hypothetical protein
MFDDFHSAIQLVMKEKIPTEHFWWLSFQDQSGFLGVVITRAENLMMAEAKSIALGIRPNTHFVGFDIPINPLTEEFFGKHLNKFLSESKLRAEQLI